VIAVRFHLLDWLSFPLHDLVRFSKTAVFWFLASECRFVICELKYLQIGFMGLNLESKPKPRNVLCSIYKALCDCTPVENSNVYRVL